jgi:hypothetical protein
LTKTRKLRRTAVARPFVGPHANREKETWDHEMYFTAVEFFYREHDDPVAVFKTRREWLAKTAKKYAAGATRAMRVRRPWA